MQRILNKLSFLVGDINILQNMPHTPVLPIFSDQVLDFLSKLSEILLHDSEAKKYTDIISYAFWIRRKSIEKEKKSYADDKCRIGRGIAFQIVPSNVPVQFAVSMTYSLIAGNMSVVRVSRKNFAQTEIICKAINKAIDECVYIKPYICMIKYEHDSEVTKALSAICDVRIIFGGNSTINNIRSIPVSPRCIELGFADRYSFAVIDSDEYLKVDPDVVATDFYIDTFYSDQNACSSSRLVIWTGNSISEARSRFWQYLRKEVQKKYTLNEISGSDKLLNTALLAINYPEIREIRNNNSIVRIELMDLYDGIMKYKGNSGYFFEYEADDLQKIIPILGKECQTITFLGNPLKEKINDIVIKNGVLGVDRIVPMGHSMDLSFVWDGYDLPIALSRVVSDL